MADFKLRDVFYYASVIYFFRYRSDYFFLLLKMEWIVDNDWVFKIFKFEIM